MADIGIRRPADLDKYFHEYKKYDFIQKFTELIVLAAYVGFYFDERGDGPFEKPVEWKYFDDTERNALYLLAIAHTAKVGGKAEPDIVSSEKRKEMFEIIERYAHGGLKTMSQQGVFSGSSKEAFGNALASFVRNALVRVDEKPIEAKTRSLLDELRQLRGD